MESETISEKSVLIEQLKEAVKGQVMWEMLVTKVEENEVSNTPRLIVAIIERLTEYQIFKYEHLKEQKEILEQQKKNLEVYETHLQKIEETADSYKRLIDLLSRLLEILKNESEAQTEKDVQINNNNKIKPNQNYSKEKPDSNTTKMTF